MNNAEPDYTAHFFEQSIDTNRYESFVLGADVGGTTTNIAVAGVKNKNITLLFSLDFETKHLQGFFPALTRSINFAKEEYDIHLSKGCIGAAGIVSSDLSYVDLTNIPWNIDTKEIIKKTSLSSLFILNDFQVLGYSLNTVNMQDETEVIPIRKTASHHLKETRILLGSGTGLGKTILRYDNNHQLFHAYSSEGGHVDIPIYSTDELALIEWIRNKKHANYPVTYEDILSGSGLTDIYSFLRLKNKFEETEYTKIVDETADKPALISKYRIADRYCEETFRLFQNFFARCAKNLALDTLALGGVFIAGGIAIKNKDIFLSNEFKKQFNQCYMQKDFIQKVPIYLLSNYYASLKGACFAAACDSIIINNQTKA